MGAHKLLFTQGFQEIPQSFVSQSGLRRVDSQYSTEDKVSMVLPPTPAAEAATLPAPRSLPRAVAQARREPPASVASLSEHFSSLPDPREAGLVEHKLLDIITMAVCGVICGADSWVEVEEFGKARYEWLKGFLELPNGIASHDTFGHGSKRVVLG